MYNMLGPIKIVIGDLNYCNVKYYINIYVDNYVNIDIT